MTRLIEPPMRMCLTFVRIFWLYFPLFFWASSAYAQDEIPLSSQTPSTDDGGPIEDSAKNLLWYSLHIQGTSTTQGHPSFHSFTPAGPQSMGSAAETATTNDITLFAGVKLGDLELYANPEMDQGFGLSNTYGVAGYPSGEAYKVGMYDPYFQMQRLFGRYIVNLGGENQTVDEGFNQLAGQRDADNIILTFGKFSVVDIFDTNSYAHDPRADFFNWSMIDMGAFDYAANSWGFTYGGAAEWTQSWWTLRGGVFDMSREPNQEALVRGFGQYQTVLEAEERHEIFDRSGKIKALFFLTSADMGSYEDALTLADQMGTTPSTALVRHWQTRPGGGLNFEQQITSDLGSFMRASINDGTKEAYDYTDINQSISGDLSLKGERWNRSDDVIGMGGSLNAVSKEAQSYFAAGGQGILIGDGQLPSYAGEEIFEAYYKAALMTGITTTLDYQHIVNPAYDTVRGPIDFFAIRLHLEY